MKLIEYQQKWSNNRIYEAVELHITLKAQGGLTPDKEWVRKVVAACKDFGPFNISLDKPEFFGEDILYLSASSKELYKLHKKLVLEISPSSDLIKKYFELEDFTPHLTLGKVAYGLSKQNLQDMARLAEEELSPYPIFEVKFIRVYQEVEKSRYITYLDIPLSQVS